MKDGVCGANEVEEEAQPTSKRHLALQGEVTVKLSQNSQERVPPPQLGSARPAVQPGRPLGDSDS